MTDRILAALLRVGFGALVILGWPPFAEAQPVANAPRIGYLITAPLDSPEGEELRDAFRQGLRERGWVEGQNIVIDYRSADGKIERFPDLAAELVRLKVDLIVAGPTPAARAARQATATIPIVASTMGDPIGDGLVQSLARPGGNVTGLTFLGPALVPKRLELLKQALPRATRVAALWQPGAFSDSTASEMLNATEAGARSLGVRLQRLGVRGASDLDGAFSAMAKARADAVLVLPGTLFFAERRRIVELAAKHRLPSMFNARQFAELGGLMSYGANAVDLNRRAAGHVDRILRGARAADLPVEQPTKFDLVINLRTAKALGLTIPQSVLIQADQVIR